MNESFIQVNNLKKYFYKGRSVIKAVDNVSFNIKKGETLGLLGESGSGKTTLGRTLAGLYKGDSGEILLQGVNIDNYKRKDLAKKVQILFQNPASSLDPRMKAEAIIGEPMGIHNIYNEDERKAKTYNLINIVGLKEEYLTRYPHQFSGGEQQRLAIARALALEPEFIVLDEALSSLDIIIQSQMVNLLKELQKNHNLTYLFISHNLPLIKSLCHRTITMDKGTLLE